MALPWCAETVAQINTVPAPNASVLANLFRMIKSVEGAVSHVNVAWTSPEVTA
jgi:hypothetical protein